MHFPSAAQALHTPRWRRSAAAQAGAMVGGFTARGLRPPVDPLEGTASGPVALRTFESPLSPVAGAHVPRCHWRAVPRRLSRQNGTFARVSGALAFAARGATSKSFAAGGAHAPLCLLKKLLGF